MTNSPATAPRLALLLGVAALSGAGLMGWSGNAHAQTAAPPATTAPATTVPAPTVPAELPAPGAEAAHTPHHAAGSAGRGVSGYLAALHDELAITPTEEPLWSTFAATMKDNAAQLGQAYRQRREQLPGMNALADMNSFIDLEQMRLDGLKKSSAAFTALYQTMPADQQKVADTVFLSDLPGAPHHNVRKPKADPKD